MEANKNYILCPEELRYLFNEVGHMCYRDEESGRDFRADKMVLDTFASLELAKIKNHLNVSGIKTNTGDWEVVHLDGDIENNRLDNLEYVFFCKGNRVTKDEEELSCKIIDLKEENQLLREKIEEYKSMVTIAKAREENANKKVRHIEKINRELNKEILTKEKEANKYWHMLNEKMKDGNSYV